MRKSSLAGSFNRKKIMATYAVANDMDMVNYAPTEGSVNPDTHLTTDDFDAHTEIKLFVTLEGSLEEFARGEVKPIWSADQGAEHIYQRIAGFEGDAPRFEGDTSKGLLLDMHLMSFQSNFPVHIGATITGVTGKTATADGKRFAFVVPKNSSSYTPDRIFEARNKTTREMIATYNDTSPELMESHCYKNAATGKTMLHNNSPLAKMMRANAAALGNMTFGLLPGEDGMLGVDTAIVDTCIAAYRDQQKVEFTDMKKFQIVFSRIGESEWNSERGVCDNLLKGNTRDLQVAKQRMTNRYQLCAQINAKLVLYGQEEK